MKPGIAKSTQDKKEKVSLLKPERQSDLNGSEQINFQTSEAAFNDPPIKTKSNKKERKMADSTDSDEMESVVN